MGAYLSKPVLDKHSECGENAALKYGATCMQGWRMNQEDAHNCLLDVNDGEASLFAVYDGHGGHEVAEYSSKVFPQFLTGLKNWQDGKIKEALVESFLQFDASLLEEDVVQELNKIANENASDTEEEEEDEDKELLLEEAFLPIEILAKRYGIPLESLEHLRAKKREGGVPPDAESKENLRPTRERRLLTGMQPKKRRVEGVDDTEPPPTGENGATENENTDTPKITPAVNGVCQDSPDSNPDDGRPPSPPPKRSRIEAEGKRSPEPEKIEVDTDNTDSKQSTEAPGETVKPNGQLPDSESDQQPMKEEPLIKKPEPLQVDVDHCFASLSSLTEGIFDKTVDYLAMLDHVSKELGTVGGPFHAFKPETVASMYKRVGDQHRAMDEIGKAAHAYAAGIRVHPAHPDLKQVLVEELSVDFSTGDSIDYKKVHFALKRIRKGKGLAEGGPDAEKSGDEEEDVDYVEELLQLHADEEDSSDDDEDGSTSGEDEESEELASLEADPDETEIAVPSDFIFDQKAAGGVNSGTTACVCIIRSGTVYVANAGDSRCVLSRAGQAVDLSVDHKPEDPVELLRIKKAGGHIDDGRVNGGLNLSRAIGDHAYKRNKKLTLAEQMISSLPDVQEQKIQPEDEFLVLACDGIWGSMSSQEVVDFVKEKMTEKETLEKICERLCDKCLAADTWGDGEGCDNMTVLIVLFKENLPAAPADGDATKEEATSDRSNEAPPSNAESNSNEDSSGSGSSTREPPAEATE